MDIVSACLVGVNCRFDGGSKTDLELLARFQNGELIPVCPEQLGGLTTPREPAEFKNGKYLTKSGNDVTANYLLGASEALKIAKLCKAECAYLKSNSPMCGANKIYDGTFSGKKVDGDGAFTKLLKENKITVFSK